MFLVSLETKLRVLKEVTNAFGFLGRTRANAVWAQLNGTVPENAAPAPQVM